MVGKNILVIGSGGREHAICWKLNQSSKVDKIYALPGSCGIESLEKCENLTNINIKDFKAISLWCSNNFIEFVIVGPEDPLAQGIADELKKHKIKCFGPGAQGAKIEADKKWAKDFMIRHKIPTARYDTFTNVDAAKNFLKNPSYNALVVKASGLAAGKGVVVAKNSTEACLAVDEILGDKKYGTAGDVVVIEELLIGEEVSVLAFVDSNNVKVMLPAQDHKRLREYDEGPNTGGMGAYCPCPLINEKDLEFVKRDVLQKAVDGLRKEGIEYCGVLYAGMMLTKDGPKVLEFNCRFGDPETQVILTLLDSDLYDVMIACCTNKLNDIKLNWKNNLAAVGVVMASAGYPETSTKGCIIEGLLKKNTESRIIFHSGVAFDSGKYLTNGGRVLIAVSVGSDLKEAAVDATKMCDGIKFLGADAQYRKDIGAKGFKISLSYKDSGVDIDAGDDLVQRIKLLARGTIRPGVLGGIGGFGGLFNLNELPYKNPVICEVVSGVDSKLRLALDFEMYENIGYDLVAQCCNDVLESGAEPIAFLDYIACGKLQVPTAAKIVTGISEGCRDANCALLGGETAEMPSVYEVGKYDIAGYCAGILEENFELPKIDQIIDGDLIIGLPSNGLHIDGFSYIHNFLQKIGVNLNDPSEFGNKKKSFAHELLLPTKMYVKDILPLIKSNSIKALANVKNGLTKNILKIIPENHSVDFDFNDVEIPEVFGWLAVNGNLTNQTILENLNCGIGLIFIVAKENFNWKSIKNAKCLGKIHKSVQKSVKLINVENAFEKVIQKFGNIKTKRSMEIKVKCFENLKSDIMQMLRKETARNETIFTQSGKALTKVSKCYKKPILVIGTDGVGTKIKIAQQNTLNSTVGIDLVAMCANDILCNGAEPLTYLSYYACGQIQDLTAKTIVNGVIEGSKQAECCLIDSHTVEVPLLYKNNVYDLAGFSLGVAEFDNILPRLNDIKEGDIVLGLPSSGVHSNGFSLIHKIMEHTGQLFENKAPFGNKSFAEEFLVPTKIYVHAIKPLLENKLIKGLAHITGGGLIENIPRILQKDLGVKLDAKKWEILPIFGWLAQAGNVTYYEMQRTFNCGLGLVLVIDPKDEHHVMECLKFEHKCVKIGEVIQRKSTNTPQVTIENFEQCMKVVQREMKAPKKRTAVLISGSGTNLQVLIDSTRDSSLGMGAEISLVISNKSNAFGLERAKTAGIPTLFINHKDFSTREEFDEAMHQKLKEHNIELICLAGFMRILSEKFIRLWKCRLINIHPSLLPKHPGLHVQQKAIDSGDTESGCTVHFVDEGVDTGPIILKEKVPILPGDTVETLTARIQKAEHYAFPRALKLIATGRMRLID